MIMFPIILFSKLCNQCHNELEKIDNKFFLLTVLNKAFTKYEITEPCCIRK